MRILTKVKHTCIQEDTVIFSTAARRKWMLNNPDGAKSSCQPHARWRGLSRRGWEQHRRIRFSAYAPEFLANINSAFLVKRKSAILSMRYYHATQRQDESINQGGPRVPRGIHQPNCLPPRQTASTQYPLLHEAPRLTTGSAPRVTRS